MSIAIMNDLRDLRARVESLEADNKKLKALVVQSLDKAVAPPAGGIFSRPRKSKAAPVTA